MLGQYMSASCAHRTALAIFLAFVYSPAIFAAPSKFLPTDLDTRNDRPKLQGINTCGGNPAILDPPKRVMCLDPYEKGAESFCDGLSENHSTMSGPNIVSFSSNYTVQHSNLGCPPGPYTINFNVTWVGNTTCSTYDFSDTSWNAGTCKGTFKDMILSGCKLSHRSFDDLIMLYLGNHTEFSDRQSYRYRTFGWYPTEWCPAHSGLYGVDWLASTTGMIAEGCRSIIMDFSCALCCNDRGSPPRVAFILDLPNSLVSLSCLSQYTQKATSSFVPHNCATFYGL